MASENEAYVRFVQRTIDQLALGLEEAHGGGTAPESAAAIVKKVGASGLSARERVLVSRFVLARNDATYLQAGLAALWSSAAADGNTARELAPAGLYAGPDALEGIGEGMRRALNLKRLIAYAQNGEAFDDVRLARELVLALFQRDEMDDDEIAALANDAVTTSKEFEDGTSAVTDASDAKKRDAAVKLLHTVLSNLVYAMTHADGEDGKALFRKIFGQGCLGGDDDDSCVAPQGFGLVGCALQRGVALSFARGLVGQRGPLQPAIAKETSPTHAEADATRPYIAPDAVAARRALDRMDAVGAAEGDAPSVSTAAPTARVARTAESYLSSYGAHLPGATVSARDVERPCEVRWWPDGDTEAGVEAGAAAALEHMALALTTAATKAKDAGDDATVVGRRAIAHLRHLAVACKLVQRPLLESLQTRAKAGDAAAACAPPQVATGRLFTRPCRVAVGGRGDGQCPVEYPHDLRDGAPACVHVETSAKAVEGAHEEKRALAASCAASTAAAAGTYVAPDVAMLLRSETPGSAAAASTSAVPTLTDPDELVEKSRLDIRALKSVPLQHVTDAKRLVRNLTRGVAACEALLHDDENRKDLEEAQAQSAAIDRRDGLWTEFHRHLGIASDKLWIFVRLLSGFLGDDVNSVLTMADDQSARATREMRRERSELAKATLATQQKIVEIIVGGMAKNATLTFDTGSRSTAADAAKQQQLVVIDGQTQQQLKELASGTSGRPFFESTLAKKLLSEQKAPLTLSALLKELAQVGNQLQSQMQTTNNAASSSDGQPTLTELSHPSNSYFVSLKPDAVAAIRNAHEIANVALAERGGRRLALYECIESGCGPLVTRFAELTAHILVATRSSTGVSAQYASMSMLMLNSMQSRMALNKFVNFAGVYGTRVGGLGNTADDPDTLKANRNAYLTSSAAINETVVAQVPRLKRPHSVLDSYGQRYIPAHHPGGGWFKNGW